MTIRFIDGFDTYFSRVDANRKNGWHIEAGYIISTSAPWGVGRSLAIGATIDSGGQAWAFMPKTGSPAAWGSEITVGLAFYHRDPSETGTFGISKKWLAISEYVFPNSFRDLIYLFTADDGSLIVYRNDSTPTILWSQPSGFFEFGSWDYWELAVVLDNSAGKVRLDRNGETLCNLTGIDTIPNITLETPPKVACVAIDEVTGSVNIPTEERRYDDLYMGDSFNDILGPQRIVTLRPNGDAHPSPSNSWLPSTETSPPGSPLVQNYEMVDDDTIDADATYVYTETVDAEDMYTVEDLPPNTKIINAVKQSYFAKKTQTETHSMVGLVESGSTKVEGPELYLAPYYRGGESIIFLTDPNTAGSWTEAAVNALKIGHKLKK